MFTRWGALPEEWVSWSDTLGLTADLLPVVCKPGMPLSPGSKMRTYGKAPSLYTHGRTVCGIAEWTSIQATKGQIQDWSIDPDYGICLQTRHLRALDVDVTTPECASRLKTFLTDFFLPSTPVRYRRDSSKFLMLFYLDGDWGKRSFPTQDGLVEFLATGQQCLVAGTHKDGCRYEWLHHDPFCFPRLTAAQWEDLWEQLVMIYATGEPTISRASRARTHDPATIHVMKDPVLEFLHRTDRILAVESDGRRYLECPWKADHTTEGDVSSTCYFPADTGGYEVGHFLCLHAHCQSRTDMDFLYALGWTLDGFDVLPDDESTALQAFGLGPADPLIGANPVPLDTPLVCKKDKAGHPFAYLEGVVAALLHPKLKTRFAYDTFLEDLLIWGPQNTAWRRVQDVDYVRLRQQLALTWSFHPVSQEMMAHAVLDVADRYQFDSGQLWLRGLPEWDGVPRIATFCRDYLGCAPSAYHEAVGRYLWTALAGRVLEPGVQADMALILVSAQGTGKTTTVKNLVPAPCQYVEIDMTLDDKEKANLIRGKLVVELAELRGLRTREMEHTKAWISRIQEEYRPIYTRHPRMFFRRCIIIGTTNEDQFLGDHTGNRRWLPIRVGAHQDVARLAQDRALLWAEGRECFLKSGVAWQDADRLARQEHDTFMVVDGWEEKIAGWLSSQTDPFGGVQKLAMGVSSRQILHDVIGLTDVQIRTPEMQRIAAIMKRIGFHQELTRIEGVKMRIWRSDSISCEDLL